MLNCDEIRGWNRCCWHGIRLLGRVGDPDGARPHENHALARHSRISGSSCPAPHASAGPLAARISVPPSDIYGWLHCFGHGTRLLGRVGDPDGARLHENNLHHWVSITFLSRLISLRTPQQGPPTARISGPTQRYSGLSPFLLASDPSPGPRGWP